jgi:hypothetical protein
MVERREYQRLRLPKPILATLDEHGALVIDVGVGGAFLEHRGRANKGLRFRLGFKWQGSDITYDAEVVRSDVVRQGGQEGVVSHSAVRFIAAHGESEMRLHHMMVTFVSQLLEAHRANAGAAGKGAALLASIGQARRDRAPGLVRYRWNGKGWSHAPTKDQKQQSDGFTVAAFEDQDELAILCATFEAADEEGRRLIRLVAELSAHAATK